MEDVVKYRIIKDFSLLCNVWTGCGAHPASYFVGTVKLFSFYVVFDLVIDLWNVK
jgi:hypothetical protein